MTDGIITFIVILGIYTSMFVAYITLDVYQDERLQKRYKSKWTA